MCGIVGYTGFQEVKKILLSALSRLEYRGYDSAGLAILNGKGLVYEKKAGPLTVLQEALRGRMIPGHVGIGHVRWATHGFPNETNAHPHFSCQRDIAVVHNGIIENFQALKEKLQSRHTFVSHTDTEVVAHLLEEQQNDADPIQGLLKILRQLRGSFALAVLFQKHRDRLFGVRRGSPLVVGVGQGETFLASDIPAILPYSRRIIFLEENEVVQLSPESIRVVDERGRKRDKKPVHISWGVEQAAKNGFPSFMLKEIFEQERTLQDAFSLSHVQQGRLALEVEGKLPSFRGVDRLVVVAAGTAYHAGLVAKYALERLARIPTEVFLSSEFRTMNPILSPRTLVVCISQSGETADTLFSAQVAKERKVPVLAICNAVGSSLTRTADAVLPMRCGLEIGVAATKTYTAQLMVSFLLSLYLAQERKTLDKTQLRTALRELKEGIGKAGQVLSRAEEIQEGSRPFAAFENFMYIARGINYPNALEGALKLKEISFLHAEGYAAGEMKHGPLALVCPTLPVVAILTQGPLFQKTLSNLQEIHARGGQLITITDGPMDPVVQSISRRVISLPLVDELFSPLLTVLPLQLFAYAVAVSRGRDVDHPRNLAKSVTVE